jgi:hypothetical protein
VGAQVRRREKLNAEMLQHYIAQQSEATAHSVAAILQGDGRDGEHLLSKVVRVRKP